MSPLSGSGRNFRHAFQTRVPDRGTEVVGLVPVLRFRACGAKRKASGIIGLDAPDH